MLELFFAICAIVLSLKAFAWFQKKAGLVEGEMILDMKKQVEEEVTKTRRANKENRHL